MEARDKNPHLMTPNGVKVNLEVSDYVPVLAAPCLDGIDENDKSADKGCGEREETPARGSLAAPASDNTLPDHRNVYVHRVKEITISDELQFPVQDGTLRHEDPLEDERTSIEASRPLGDNRDDLAKNEHDVVYLTEDGEAAGDRKREGPQDADYWEMKGDTLIRYHETPRRSLFSPLESLEDIPISLDRIDVTRNTRTSIETQDEMRIIDCWDGVSESDKRPLSDNWTGETKFDIIPDDPGPGKHVVAGRITRTQSTSRPDDIWPEMWEVMSAKQRKAAKQKWDIRKKEIEEARQRRRSRTPATSSSSSSVAPALPTMTESPMEQEHRERDFADPLKVLAMVTTPIKPSEWSKNRAAQSAVDAEWKKLRDMRCWEEETVQEYDAIKNKALQKNITVHFGRVFALCVEKHSELPPDKRKYKGRVVFQGNNVRDESGMAAVFTDQGSSASFIQASKLLDTVAMLPGNTGGQSDAPQASTQALLYGDGLDDAVETWIIIPEEQRPASWSKFRSPVVRLRLALYGHPLSGLFWEKTLPQAAKSCWFRTHSRLGVLLRAQDPAVGAICLRRRLQDGRKCQKH